MQLIETKTLGTAAASIEFTSIPQDGTDLLVAFSVRSSQSATFGGFTMAINGSTSNQSTRYLFGSGSSVLSGTLGSGGFQHDINGANSTSNTFSNIQYYFPNYSGSTTKSFSEEVTNENNATDTYMMIQAGLWNQTAAITSLTFTVVSGNFVIGSTVSLYKITKGSSGGVVVS